MVANFVSNSNELQYPILLILFQKIKNVKEKEKGKMERKQGIEEKNREKSKSAELKLRKIMQNKGKKQITGKKRKVKGKREGRDKK